MNFSDLTNIRGQEFKSLSKCQRMIAGFIMQNYDKAAFMTASALGKTVGVSESTVVRFACALGFEGYPELQKNLQEIIKNKLTSVQRLNLMEGLEPDKILDTILKQEITNLKETREKLDTESFMKAIDKLSEARKIFVIGFRSSSQLAQFLVYYLSYIIENPQLITVGTADIYAQLMHATKDDVVIGIGFPRYSSQTVEGLKFAKTMGANIVTITDNKMSPLYEIADTCILTKSDMNSFVDSLVAPLSIINALIIMLGLKKKDVLVENFSVMEHVWKEKHVYAKAELDAVDDEEEKDGR